MNTGENGQAANRDGVNLMALRHLRDNGPDELGTINTDEELAAALVYAELKHQGLADSRNPKPGVILWDITPKGLAHLGATT